LNNVINLQSHTASNRKKTGQMLNFAMISFEKLEAQTVQSVMADRDFKSSKVRVIGAFS